METVEKGTKIALPAIHSMQDEQVRELEKTGIDFCVPTPKKGSQPYIILEESVNFSSLPNWAQKALIYPVSLD